MSLDTIAVALASLAMALSSATAFLVWRQRRAVVFIPDEPLDADMQAWIDRSARRWAAEWDSEEAGDVARRFMTQAAYATRGRRPPTPVTRPSDLLGRTGGGTR